MPPKSIKGINDIGKRNIGMRSDNAQDSPSFVFRYLDKTFVPDYPVLQRNNCHLVDISPVNEGVDTIYNDDNYYAVMNYHIIISA